MANSPRASAKNWIDCSPRSRELRSEWDRLHEVKEVTDAMSLRRPPEETWEQYFESVYNRAERGFAWILLSMGAIVMMGWALWVGLEELWVPLTCRLMSR